MPNRQQVALHGVLMNISGVGTLIRGQSAIGKSEAALCLIDRNHLFIADDMPLFTRKDDTIIGRAHPDYQEFMHVRGIGIINTVKLFGPGAVIDSSPVELIIYLDQENSYDIQLSSNEQYFEILGVKIPQVTIPILLSLNLAIVIETVVKNFLLKSTTGYDASCEFENIQNQQIGNHQS